MTTFTVLRPFPLNRAERADIAGQLTATPGDTLRCAVDDWGCPAFTLVRADGGAEVKVDTSPSEFGRYVREES